MNAKAQEIINSLNEVKESAVGSFFIIETGTIRIVDDGYEQGDGHSTRYIAEWCRDNSEGNYILVSIDLSTKVCFDYLHSLDLGEYVHLIEGNSLTMLPIFGGIGFCYLDSANDHEQTLKEFLIVWDNMREHGIVMVDDCNLSSAELFKGDLLIPYLIANNIEFEQIGNQLKIRK